MSAKRKTVSDSLEDFSSQAAGEKCCKIVANNQEIIIVEPDESNRVRYRMYCKFVTKG